MPPADPPPTADRLAAIPKVLLHDHLDGGLRPQTILELADEQGYDPLPASRRRGARPWLTRGADARSCCSTSRPSRTPSA